MDTLINPNNDDQAWPAMTVAQAFTKSMEQQPRTMALINVCRDEDEVSLTVHRVIKLSGARARALLRDYLNGDLK